MTMRTLQDVRAVMDLCRSGLREAVVIGGGPLSLERARPSFGVKLMDFLRGGRERDRALELLSASTAKKAVKCDLCAGYDDYACVSACPVGAAFRIDPQKILPAETASVGLAMKRAGR